MNDKNIYDLNLWQAVLLLLLEHSTGRNWMPEDHLPDPELPDYIKQFGDVSRYQARYSKSDLKAILEITADSVAVFFADPNQTYTVQRPDGSDATKYVFTARTSEEQPKQLKIQQGARVLVFKEQILNKANDIDPCFADNEIYIEICEPAGGVLRIRGFKQIAWQRSDGSWAIDA